MNRILNSSRSFNFILKRQNLIKSRNNFKPISNRNFFNSSNSNSIPIIEELLSNSLPNIEPTLFPLIIAVLLASNDEDEEEDLHNPPWRVEDFSKEGLGFGAVANQNITKGQLLIAERPICIWSQGLTTLTAQALFDKMSVKAQAVYMSLAKNNIPGLDDIRAIRATNGFAIQFPSSQEGSGAIAAMVFPKIARLNHSCCPTASQAMNFKTLRMEVYAITNITKDSEIFIEYIPNLITQTKLERQASLKSSFGFPACLCSVCSGSIEEVAKSDGRRMEIKSLMNSVSGSGRSDRKGTLAKLDRVRLLLKEEGYNGLPEFEDPGLSQAYAVYFSLYSRGELPSSN